MKQIKQMDEFDKFTKKFHSVFTELFGNENPDLSMLDNLLNKKSINQKAIEIMEEKYKMTFKELCEDPTLLGNMEMNEALTIIKEALETESISDVITLMKAPSIQRYIQFLISKGVFEEPVSDGEYQNLYLIIYILQVIYTDGKEESPLSDYDYDRLYELMKGFGTELITTPIHSGGNIVHHKYKTLRGTLAKIYVLDKDEDSAANKSRRTLEDWVNHCEEILLEKTGKKVNLWDEEIYVFPKWDGISVVFEFDTENNLVRAITRGNTETNEGKDVTFIFSTLVSSIRDKGMSGKPYGLKTEVMVHEKDRDSYNKKYHTDYKSTRSIANSIINTETVDGREQLLEVVPLRTSTLREDGTENLQELAEGAFLRPYIRCRVKDTKAIRDFAYDHKSINGLNTDGAVLYIINEDLRKLLGRKDHKNQYEIAFKFNEEISYTKIKNIKFEVTPFGRVFPTAEFEPVKMKGNTVKNVSLGSFARFNELQLAKGDTVKILYEIIPYLVMDEFDAGCKRSGNTPIQAPVNCPECGQPLSVNENQTILNCVNPDCPCRVRGKILNYVKKMGMKQIGEATIKDLYEEGLIKEIPDLYHISKHEFVKMDGYDKISVEKILTEIKVRSKDIPAAIFMGAIGIESIGKKTFEKIFEKYDIEELIWFAEDGELSKLIEIPGIKEKQAEKILDGVEKSTGIIHQLLLNEDVSITYPEKETGKFIAVFHKIRSASLSEEIVKLGGIVEENLTKATTFLIVPNGFGDQSSGASDKARKYGIPIVEFDNVLGYIKEHHLNE